MIQKNNPRYRWYIMALAGLTYAAIAGAARMCVPVLFKQISADINLDLVAMGTVWGMDPLAGVFVGLPAGLLADRFGVKKTLTVLCLLAAVFGALRGLSGSFFTMAATMFLFGITAAATPAIVPKATAEWFSGKELGLANGLLNVAWSVGAVLATQFSATALAPAIGGWRWVMVFYAGPCLLLGLLWIITGREKAKDPAEERPVSEVPFRQSLARVIRIKEVWIIGFATMFAWAASMGAIGYLPTYLKDNGWQPATADSVVTLFNAVTMLGSIPMVLLSDRLKTRKGVLVFSVAVFGAGLILMPYLNATGVWLMIGVCGFLRSSTGSLFNVMLFENKSIGATYGGTAVGLANTISMLGAFAGPPLGNSLEPVSKGFSFVFWGILALAAIPVLLLVRTKKKAAPALS